MLSPQYYSTVYLIVVVLLLVFQSAQYARLSDRRITRNDRQSPAGSLLITTALILFIGMRPISVVFVDMVNYNVYYNFAATNIREFKFDWDVENLLFDNLFNFMAISGINITSFFLLMALIYFGCMWWAIRRWFPDDTLYALVIYLGAFSTFSYGTNGLKAGAATSIFLLALSFRDKFWISILLALLSWGIHHSMFTVVAAYCLVLVVKNPKWYMAGWCMCILFAATNINPFMDFFVSLSDDKGAGYLSNENIEWGGKLGFRADFLIYSAVPVAIGYYMIFRKNVRSATYIMLYNLYLTVNALWILCMYIPFNNRVAYLSWFLLPIVSVYPFFRVRLGNEQYSTLNYISWFYMLFTLGMTFIYYG